MLDFARLEQELQLDAAKAPPDLLAERASAAKKGTARFGITHERLTFAFVVVLAYLGGIATGVGMLGTGERTRAPESEASKAQSPAQLDYFSTFEDGGATRIFNFPDDQALGLILISPRRKFVALGNTRIANFEPCTFFPSEYCMNNPELMRRFRSDEIDAIGLGVSISKRNMNNKSTHEDFRDSMLKNMTHLTGLRQLNIPFSSVTEQGVKYLEALPNLRYLNVDQIHAKGPALASLNTLSKLEYLNINFMSDVKPLIKKLKQITNLQRLFLTHCDLDYEDVKNLSALPSLKNIDVSGNSAVDDRSLLFLANSGLSCLQMRGCKVTEASIPTLKKMRNLKELVLSDEWSLQAQAACKTALPRVSVKFVPYVESETAMAKRADSLSGNEDMLGR